MKNKQEVKEVLLQMCSYCASAERCCSDIQKKLDKKELSVDEQEYILHFLINENFLNEERYAKAYVHDKYKFSKWGKRKIAQNLYVKSVEPKAIEAGLARIDKDEYLANLKSILVAKQRTIRAKNDYEMKQKLARFALGRGFDYADIARFLPDLEGEW